MITDAYGSARSWGILGVAERALALADAVPAGFRQLLFRIAIAGVFWKAGQTKIASWELTVALFRDEYRVPVLPPEIAATLGTVFELGCPVLLVLGLATRLATLPLLGMTAVIQIVVFPENWVEHLTWAALLLAILTRGPGALSLDHAIVPALRRRLGG